MRIPDLLAIDVDAELRTLCAQQIQGSWQLPAELIRFAIRQGAESAEVSCTRKGFILTCPGAMCSSEYLQEVAAALDQTQAVDDRHGAIVALEEDGAQALLWCVGSPGARVRVVARKGDVETTLTVRPDRRPRFATSAAEETATSLEVRFEAPGFDAARSGRWLEIACRFAPISVIVNGDEVPQGFRSAIHSVSLGRPLPGGIALTVEGDAPHLWLLRRGVLAARAAIPGYPPFEAVLELGDVTSEATGPDELRRAVEPHLESLLDQAARVLVDVVESGPNLGPEAAQRVVTLALLMARRKPGIGPITELEVIPSVESESGQRRTVSLADLRRECAAGRTVLWSVPPSTVMSDLPAGSRFVLLLNPEQHALLTELVPGPIQRPEPRRSSRPLSRLRADWQRRIERIKTLLAGRKGLRPLRENELLEAEREFLRRFEGITDRERGEPLEVGLCRGVGEVRRQDGRILLPRNNPLVVCAMRLTSEDELWFYPTVLALMSDHADPPSKMAHQFRERIGRGCIARRADRGPEAR